MTERLVSSWKAPYAVAETVFACHAPATVETPLRLEDFARRVTLMTRSPSIFQPRACIAGEMAPVRNAIAAMDWNAGRWHVFDRFGNSKESLSEEAMRERYAPCSHDPFMFVSTDRTTIEVEGVVDGYEASFLVNGRKVENLPDFLRGMVRLDADGDSVVAADAPLFVQTAVMLLAGDDAWAAAHTVHIELLWRLRRTHVGEDGAWADMKTTVDLLDHPAILRGNETYDAAMASAFTSSVVSILQTKSLTGRPSMSPPRPAWERAGYPNPA